MPGSLKELLLNMCPVKISQIVTFGSKNVDNLFSEKRIRKMTDRL